MIRVSCTLYEKPTEESPAFAERLTRVIYDFTFEELNFFLTNVKENGIELNGRIY